MRGLFAFLDPLLRRAALVVEAHQRVGFIVTSMGLPSRSVRYKSFRYQAESWSKARMGEFFDGFLTVVAATVMLYGLRSTLLQ